MTSAARACTPRSTGDQSRLGPLHSCPLAMCWGSSGEQHLAHCRPAGPTLHWPLAPQSWRAETALPTTMSQRHRFGAPGVALDMALLAQVIRRALGGVPSEVLLFGSQARGDAGPRSDIDIAVRSAQPLTHDTLVALRAAVEESNVVRRVDIVDWWTASPALRASVEREGVLWLR